MGGVRVKDQVFKRNYLESAKEAEALVLGERDEYNQGDVDVINEANFSPGKTTFWPLIWMKVMRYRSLFYGKNTTDKLLETLLDLQNYVRFETARIKEEESGVSSGPIFDPKIWDDKGKMKDVTITIKGGD